MTQHWPPGSEAPSIEHEGGLDPARRVAHDWDTLGDGTPLDMLALRDHVIGLEAELEEAHAEVEDLRRQIITLRSRRSLRLVDGLASRAARANSWRRR